MSTAKSMANQYLSAKRAAAATGKSNSLTVSSIASSQQHRFKSSTSNLASNSISSRNRPITSVGLKATSMTNLASENNNTNATKLQRPASRNALDSIHNGMNAKYAQVQSKVLLQNIRPQPQSSSRIPPTGAATKSDTLTRRTPTNIYNVRSTPSPAKVPTNERSAMLNKLKGLQDELDRSAEERETLKHELERERADKVEQLQQIKAELQEKLAEHDKQNEEYHQKLLEAYELADQNRRAADQVLAESRQRAEESRKKIEELETQLGELKEFVAMKEEMTDKMYELREQIREERLRYEEQLKSLHQVFENEKISNKNQQSYKDQNSNYFNRIKPSLEASSESISRKGCQKCQSGSSQLHKSEQDIYGSKLSTRMQDTAKSAWKSSKKFASSVITGSANLTGCRKDSGDLNRDNHVGGKSNFQQLQVAEQQHLDLDSNQAIDHTSVVQVNSANGSDSCVELNNVARQQNQDASLIRVDANRKLTIVTKFNDDQLLSRQQSQNRSSPVQSIEMAPSSGGSERSRCESSSSGRGSSSDAGSAASQNGDDKEEPSRGQTDLKTTATTATGEREEKGNAKPTSDKKTHKRKASSLFRASKVVFGGSQASLNKLKNFFNGAGKQLRTQQQPQTADGNHYQVSNGLVGAAEIADAENSRLRCMELNQAIKVPSISGQTSSLSQTAAKATADQEEGKNEHHNEDDSVAAANSKVEIGQGESESENDQQQQQNQAAAVVVCCQ